MAGLSASDVLLDVGKTKIPDHCDDESINIANVDITSLKNLAEKCGDLEATYTYAFVNLTKLLHHALKCLRGEAVPMQTYDKIHDDERVMQMIKLFASNPDIDILSRKQQQIFIDIVPVIDKCFELLNAMLAEENNVRQYLFSNKKKLAKRKAEEAREALEKAQRDAEEAARLHKTNIQSKLKELIEKYRGVQGVNSLQEAVIELEQFQKQHMRDLSDGMSSILNIRLDTLRKSLVEATAESGRELAKLDKLKSDMSEYDQRLRNDDEDFTLHEMGVAIKKLDNDARSINGAKLPVLNDLEKAKKQIEQLNISYNDLYGNFLAKNEEARQKFQRTLDDVNKVPYNERIGNLKNLLIDINSRISETKKQLPSYNIKDLDDLAREVKKTIDDMEELARHPYNTEIQRFAEQIDILRNKTSVHKEAVEILVNAFEAKMSDWKNKTERNDKDTQLIKKQIKDITSLNKNVVKPENNTLLNRFIRDYDTYAKSETVRNEANLKSDANGLGGDDAQTIGNLLIEYLDATGKYNVSDLIKNITQLYTFNGLDANNPLTYPYIVNAYKIERPPKLLETAIQDFKKNIQKSSTTITKDNSAYLRGVTTIIDLHRKIYNSLEVLQNSNEIKVEYNLDKCKNLKIFSMNVLKSGSNPLQGYHQQLVRLFPSSDVPIVSKILNQNLGNIHTFTYLDPLDITMDNYRYYVQDLTNIEKILSDAVKSLSKSSGLTPKKDNNIQILSTGRKMGGASSTSFVPIANTLAISLAVLAVSVYVSEVVKNKYADRGVMRSGLYSMASFASAYAVLMIPLAFALQTAIAVDIVWKHLQMMYIFFAILLSLAYLVPTHVHHWLSAGAMAIAWVVSIFLAMVMAAL